MRERGKQRTFPPQILLSLPSLPPSLPHLPKTEPSPQNHMAQATSPSHSLCKSYPSPTYPHILPMFYLYYRSLDLQSDEDYYSYHLNLENSLTVDFLKLFHALYTIENTKLLI